MKFDWHRVITPRAWVQMYPVDWEWDSELNELLDTKPILPAKYEDYLGQYTVSIDSKRIWTENYPYAYGYMLKMSEVTNRRCTGLPSMKTRKRLRKMILSQNNS